MVGYVYILECADRPYYTGSTKNLQKCLWEHNNFIGANHTRKKHPLKLVYVEEFNRIDDAFYREKQIQGWAHAKKKALVEGNKEKLIKSSKNYSQYIRNSNFYIPEENSVAEPVEVTMKQRKPENENLSTDKS